MTPETPARGESLVCHHGGLRRQCEACDLAERLEQAEAEVQRLTAERDRAERVMLALDEASCNQYERYEALEVERDTLRAALTAVKSQCAGHCDEFSGNIWRIAQQALGVSPETEPPS